MYNQLQGSKQISKRDTLITAMKKHVFLKFLLSFSHVQLFVTPRTAACQAPLSSTVSRNLLEFMSIESVMLSVSFSAAPFSFCPQSFPASGSFPVSWLFASGGQSFGASALSSVLPVNIQGWFPWSPCSPRDSQESYPTPQFKSINSSVLSFLYGPTLTSIHDYRKNHSFDCMDLCGQSDVSAF